MKSDDYPVTQAIRFLNDNKLAFTPYQYAYEEHGGTRQTAVELGVDEHTVIKTLVFETDEGECFILLMHGDFEASVKELARLLNVKKVQPCAEQKAMKFTGYQFGGTSPFGLRKPMQVYAEESILELDHIYINGGKRGFILKISTQDIKKVLKLQTVNVAIKK